MTDSVNEKRIAKFLHLINNQTIIGIFDVGSIEYAPVTERAEENQRKDIFKVIENYPCGFSAFAKSDIWGDVTDSHAWFVIKGEIPEKYKASHLRLHIDTSADGWNVYNPQFSVYKDGKIIQGLDANHRFIEFPYEKDYEIRLSAYTGSTAHHLNFRCFFEIIDDEAEKLYYDMSVLFETAQILETNTKSYADIMTSLESAVASIDFHNVKPTLFYARKIIDSFYRDKCRAESPYTVCVGHTHIDVAWLWSLERTREKACHTFSTVLALMDRFPHLVFFSSQPQLLAFIKEDEPELYERIKAKAREGRFEFEGAMWVEADCNLTSGESLIRQIIHGKKFFRDEFGVENHILWLPDVFGYSASLPQICKLTGIDTFVTSKISWNDTNRMPHDIFEWVGIDGTKIFTYFLTAQDTVRGGTDANYTTYVATSDPKCVKGCFDRMTDKALTDSTILTMGWGDGGGGPTAKMCEKALRLECGIPGMPTVKQEKVSDFIAHVKQTSSVKKLPVWDGELYLEYHRGTYTSAAKNKKYNRFMEFATADSEILSVIAEKLMGSDYPADRLFEMWRVLLLNQFHDIIPGSSIPEVYKISRRQYEKLERDNREITDKALGAILTGGEEAVFNPNAVTGGGLVFDGTNYAYIPDLPSVGFAKANAVRTNGVTVGERYIENDYYQIVFGEDMVIKFILVKESDRLIGGEMNAFKVYEDIPFNYECWNLEEYHTEKSFNPELKSVERVTRGAGAGFRLTYTFRESVITEEIIAFDKSPRIDFNAEVDWKEKDYILKTEFDTDINNRDGIFDIQYGFVSRPASGNTSWEQAKFEVCGQKYADISEGNFGLALINDCKYGYSLRRGGISLSIIKASGYPNMYIDDDIHTFRYSVIPHKGTFTEAGIIREAILFNNMPIIKGGTDTEFEAFETDGGITLSAMKKSYDGKGIVVRLAEENNSHAGKTLKFGFDFEKVFVCDAEENELYEINSYKNTVSYNFRPFEILTLKLI